jgi:hypothetical protein
MRPIPFLICALAAGCGDGGGAGPSDVIPDRAGTYSGTVVFTIATPETHCFAKGLGRLRGHGFRYRMSLDWDTKDRDSDADLGSIRVNVRVDLNESG